MKSIRLLMVAALLFCLGGHTFAQAKKVGKRVLVAYFSHSGNTRQMANIIKEKLNAEIYEIETEVEYTKDIRTLAQQAKKEIRDGFKPKLKSKSVDISKFDIIFIGSPNWWNTVAPPVSTFLSTYDFSGKTIIPFITHEGTEMGRSVQDIKTLCPGAKVLSGLPVPGKEVKESKNEIESWLNSLSILK